MFDGLPSEVRALLRADGSVIVPRAVVPWLELQLREQLRRARGNPGSSAVALLKALTTSAERVEGAANGTRLGPAVSVDVGGFLTAAQAATLTERSERGIRKALERGRLRGRKVGGLWHISPRDLENYIYRREASDGEGK